MSWTVKMWHFGEKDSIKGYSGKNFDMSWEDSLKLFHIYSKEYEKKMKERKEVQEYPNKPLEETFMDKLSDTNEAIGGF